MNHKTDFCHFEAESAAKYDFHIGYGLCYHHDYGYCDYLADEIC